MMINSNCWLSLKNQTQKTIAIGYIPTFGGYYITYKTHSMHDLLKNVDSPPRQGFSRAWWRKWWPWRAWNGAWAAKWRIPTVETPNFWDWMVVDLSQNGITHRIHVWYIC